MKKSDSAVQSSGDAEIGSVSQIDLDTNNRNYLMDNYRPSPVKFVKGQGAYLWDEAGKEFLDFLSGISVTNLGHSHPEVAEAVSGQAKQLTHVSNLFKNQLQNELAGELDLLVGDGRPAGGKSFFCNSGAEANEAAIKLARKWGAGRGSTIVCANNGFHGRTLGALAATGQPSKWEGFEPLPKGFKHFEWGDLKQLNSCIDSSVVAILLEVVQGEAGVYPADAEFLAAVQELCTQNEVLFMVDEVQTGFGRTGRWFGFQNYGISPDVITMAKAMGNGFPIGGCWAKEHVACSFQPGDHGSTFGGQPLAAAASLATIKAMKSLEIDNQASERGAYLSQRLKKVNGVVEVRGLGLLLGVELSGVSAAQVQQTCLDAGLVLNAVTPTALRLAPPLIITEDQIDHAVAVIDQSIKSLQGNQP